MVPLVNLNLKQIKCYRRMMVGELCKMNYEVFEFQKIKFMVEKNECAVISIGFNLSHRIRSVSTE